MTATESPTLAMSFELIRSRLRDPDFLAGNGLSNEVPFFVFAYDSAQENEVRERTATLVRELASDDTCRVTHFDLWDIFCELCEERGILDMIPEFEADYGSKDLLDHMHQTAPAEEYVRAMADCCRELYGELVPGRDVLIVSGVGKVYPFVRAHSIFDNAQPIFPGIPLVLMYPGVYDGQSLRLFGFISDGNYYRAFNLI